MDEDEEIIDMYATGWKATPNRRDLRKTMLETDALCLKALQQSF